MSKRAKTRSRFRVGPGGALYTVVTALILAVAIYGQTNLLFWSFGLMVGGLIVSASLSWLMLRGLEVERLLPAHGVAGEAMVLRYSIKNRKQWMPAFGVVICETWGRGGRGWRKTGPVAERPARLAGRPLGWVLHVGPNQGVLAEAPCWPMRRGMLTFERVSVSTSFPFGVIRRIVDFELPGSVLVYPQLFRMNRRTIHRLAVTLSAGRRHIDRGGGSEEFFGMREYRPGDSMKMIDWKRTARTGELVTRELTQTTPPRLLVALDLSALPELPPANTKPTKPRKGKPAPADPLLDAERAISLTASLVCDAHFNGYQTGLVVIGVPCMMFPVHHSLPHRTKMLETLSMLDLSSRTDKPPIGVGTPSVVIRPGHAPSGAASGQLLMGAAQFDEYVTQIDGGSSVLLATRAGAPTRREQIAEAEVTA